MQQRVQQLAQRLALDRVVLEYDLELVGRALVVPLPDRQLLVAPENRVDLVVAWLEEIAPALVTVPVEATST